MAKQHKMTTVSLWISGKEAPIKNQVARLRYNLDYSVKHDGDAVSTDYNNTFDLEMPISRLLELAKNSITIAWQNKTMRPLSAQAGKKWDRQVVKYEHVFPGTRVAKPLTRKELLEALVVKYGSKEAAIEALMNEEETS